MIARPPTNHAGIFRDCLTKECLTRGGVGSVAVNDSENPGYAGDLTTRQAWDVLAGDRAAVLVDVRSRPEWSFVGTPDLSSIGNRSVFLAWQNWTPGPQGAAMTPNARFVDELLATGIDKNAPTIFICRSGARSRAAAIAATRAGFARAYNLAGGFEGAHDATRHRGHVDGWKAADLPWTQD